MELSTLSLTPARCGVGGIWGLTGNKPNRIPSFNRKDWVLWADWEWEVGNCFLKFWALVSSLPLICCYPERLFPVSLWLWRMCEEMLVRMLFQRIPSFMMVQFIPVDTSADANGQPLRAALSWVYKWWDSDFRAWGRESEAGYMPWGTSLLWLFHQQQI